MIPGAVFSLALGCGLRIADTMNRLSADQPGGRRLLAKQPTQKCLDLWRA